MNQFEIKMNWLFKFLSEFFSQVSNKVLRDQAYIYIFSDRNLNDRKMFHFVIK